MVLDEFSVLGKGLLGLPRNGWVSVGKNLVTRRHTSAAALVLRHSHWLLGRQSRQLPYRGSTASAEWRLDPAYLR
jgi:hypothetical protein